MEPTWVTRVINMFLLVTFQITLGLQDVCIGQDLSLEEKSLE